ncbi:hypothetical protein I7I48_11350 [Histoplasma ohiense]|nr:hypothetical protein I7I48_11350 [Histoplasma ohiense (nom. inval.)]
MRASEEDYCTSSISTVPPCTKQASFPPSLSSLLRHPSPIHHGRIQHIYIYIYICQPHTQESQNNKRKKIYIRKKNRKTLKPPPVKWNIPQDRHN